MDLQNENETAHAEDVESKDPMDLYSVVGTMVASEYALVFRISKLRIFMTVLLMCRGVRVRSARIQSSLTSKCRSVVSM